MEYSNERQYNIIGYRKLWFFISGTLIAISVAVVALWGLKLGIDFTGGSLVEIEFKDNRPVVKDVESAVPEQLGKANIAPLGDRGMALRLRSLSEDEHQQLLASLKEKLGKDKDDDYLNESRFNSIGQTIGAELQQKAVWAIAIVLLAIILYIAWAFRKVSRSVPSWQYGVAAVMALFHDVFIPVGIFAGLGHFMGVEIDTLFITALLTVLGFSVHDTIVVFDRIRENLLKPADQFSVVVNRSVNETLARSINTSLATLLVLVTTFIFGGETIRYFILTLILGIVFGTYSSIFIQLSVNNKLKRLLLYAIFLGNLFVIVFIWWSNSGALLLPYSRSSLFIALGRLFGLFGEYLLLVQLVLIGRIRPIERLYGFDKQNILHRSLGYSLALFLLVHPLLLTIGYSGANELSLTSQFLDFLFHWQDVSRALVGLLLMIGLIFVSLPIIRKRIRYDRWHFVHLLMYAAVALIFIHQTKSGDVAPGG